MKDHLKGLIEFIHQHRSNEMNFEKLYNKVEEEIKNEQMDTQYREGLKELIEKQAVAYRQNDKEGVNAWSEFEKFVSQFEKIVLEASKKN